MWAEADESHFFKWHFNYKVVKHHIITLLQTPKAAKTTLTLHLCYKYTLSGTYTHKNHNMWTHKDSVVFIFLGWCSTHTQDYIHTHFNTLQHTRGKSRRSRSKKMWLKKNTQGHPPPHKQGISLPKTKRPEQPTHIQRNREGRGGRRGGPGKGGRGAGGDQKTCYMGGKVKQQNHSLL